MRVEGKKELMFVEMSKGWKFRINQEESWRDHFLGKDANFVVSSSPSVIDKKFFSNFHHFPNLLVSRINPQNNHKLTLKF
jgi:hypothetical protein